ncbi:hypothetical protein Poli38472_001655 [Pythium oligandrum]|uniref:isopentenyl-diphosphate Delta-isomerase n=1 Tax=Pythium oligandrum TaxID=41045 RepID=A0A8K1CUJ1_PYTOL|nr:hypothetical protein Poli38472_001655 [Pythium oligandrum]|eukprot:TMW69499.1 hypothetical protein Poli38472_001655 [Pythium oligandrum]
MLRSLLLRPTSSPTSKAAMSTTRGLASRASFEELTAGADSAQLEFMKEMIIQVDTQDNVIGPVTKKDAHLHDGILHRAFSVFLFNSKNELLIQKRAAEKITFPSYWANTCCSHPNFVSDEMEDGVGVKRAAIRKLEHELGIPTTTFDPSELKYVTTVLYKAASDSNWTEWEVDHILLARGDVSLNICPNEVAEVEFVSKDRLPEVLADETRQLSPWFRLIATRLLPQWWENLDKMSEKDSPERQIHDFS